MAFVTLAEAKAALGIPTSETSRDVALTAAVAAANAALLGIFGLTSDAVTAYEDELDVDDESTTSIWLSRWPVVEVTSITDDGETIDVADVKLWGEMGNISFRARPTRSRRYWTQGVGTVAVSYTAGWSTVPDALKTAGLVIALHSFNTAPKAGLRAERIGAYSYELGGASVAGGQDGGGGFGIPPEAERILASYRRPFNYVPRT